MGGGSKVHNKIIFFSNFFLNVLHEKSVELKLASIEPFYRSYTLVFGTLIMVFINIVSVSITFYYTFKFQPINNFTNQCG